MPKPAYVVTCYNMFFEVSHIQRIGRAALVHLKSAGYVAGGLVLARVQLSCDDRTQPPGIPGNMASRTLCHYLGATSSQSVTC